MTAVLRGRGRGGTARDAAVLPVVGVAVTLLAFEIPPRIGLLPRSSFPPLSEIFVRLAQLSVTGPYRSAVAATLIGWALAMLIVLAIAVPAGLLIGSTELGSLLARITIDFLRPIPSVALIPLLVLIYGTRPQLKVTLAVFGAVFPLLFQAMYGVRDVDPVAKDTARAFSLGWVDRVRRVIVPSCAPYLATGVRISASVALILVVTGEFLVSVDGIGKAVFVAQSGGAYAEMYAYIVTAGVLGMLINLGVHTLERRVLFWHASMRAEPQERRGAGKARDGAR